MELFKELDKFVEDYLPELEYISYEKLSAHTSMRIGGKATRFAAPKSKEQLVLLSEYSYSIGISPFTLGNGSNTIFGDVIHSLIISTKNINSIQVHNDNCLIADCGANLSSVALVALDHGLAGMEFAHGIPGSIGGAVFMNAGAYGGEMKDIVESVRVYIPNEGIKTYNLEELNLGYRFSELQSINGSVILDVFLRLSKGDKDIIKARMSELMEKRKSKQPLEYPSAGSFFKRPTGYFAGELIEKAGLKGVSIGDVEVSEKHAGFIINKGNGTYSDLVKLMNLIQDRVYEKYSVRLEPEVRIIT